MPCSKLDWLESESAMVGHANSSDAFSFISKGWREVRDSADADLRLIKARANSFKNLATSFDREIENFFNSATTFYVPAIGSGSSPPAEIEFVKNLQLKISADRRVYASPSFSKKMLEKLKPRTRIRINLSSIKNAIVSEVEDGNGLKKWNRVRFGEFWGENESEEGKDVRAWEPIQALKTRLREFEMFEGFKNSDFVKKVKSSLRSICKDPEDSKEVLPLDVSELIACLVRKSGPFLDQIGISRGIASVLQSTGYCYDGGFWTDHTKHVPSDGKRHFAIVTTASLPWMTGTAVNPLFRAAYLAQSAKHNVTLLVPWLSMSDQKLVYLSPLTFSSPEEQEVYIRKWLEERIGFKPDFKISFYPGKFSKKRRSILPAGDTSQFVPSKDADIAILEEPEHLNWYHHGRRWTDKFNLVVGVVHTNYLEYIKREKNGAVQAFLVKHINNWVIRAHCHKVLRLSAATQDLPKSVICNVHGVNPKFLKIGDKVEEDRKLGNLAFSKGAYFLGKMVWAKGFRELIDLLAKHKHDLDGFNLDVFGNGEDADEVQSAAKKLELNVNFLSGRDHAHDSSHGYKVFINPSVSDVLCTATAEALAMGKFVVCADHPSNDFFRSFRNCSIYKSSDDFIAKVKEALENEPLPLTPEERYNLSWEAATERFLEYSDLNKVLNNDRELESNDTDGKTISKSILTSSLTKAVDGGLAFAHYCITGNEFLRLCTGAIPGTRNYDEEHRKELHLSPQVENPIHTC
ncbi:digalactosyldiacylglycerol synthase 1, chloroplastic-like [Cucurbita pepo subsp. pepo]|uniref:digalactosyldiacylglycerol synthase 1, chloroplastic-like n=1 Tax=Cucurbita pepo subsp. pepo TaxID=3664 RepID=UPI000C9D26BA|nr:digalactosyldiacylglycerol synthase 1, chloroplastic-like [Cucurbita pepo subsp. pepo]